MEFTEILKNYPLLNSMFVGAGLGFGIYKGIDKLFDLFIAIKLNTSKIPDLVQYNKDLLDSNEDQQNKIDELKKIIENHDLEVKEELRKKNRGG